MNIDEIKTNWHSAKNNINPCTSPQPGGKRETSLQRLAKEYRRFQIFGAIMMLCGPMLLYNVGARSILLLVGYALLLGGGSLVDHYLSLSIKRIDVASMPLKEVLRRTLNCRKIHLWWVALALPMGIFWCAMLAYTMSADSYFIAGIYIGGTCGLVVGLHVLIRFMHTYREALKD